MFLESGMHHIELRHSNCQESSYCLLEAGTLMECKEETLIKGSCVLYQTAVMQNSDSICNIFISKDSGSEKNINTHVAPGIHIYVVQLSAMGDWHW